MSIDSPFFFLFLFPILFFLYLVAGSKLRNFILLVSSLLVYAWYDALHLPLILALIFVNYLCGLLIGRNLKDGKNNHWLLLLTILLNLALLVFFKSKMGLQWLSLAAPHHFASFSTDTLAKLLALPLGFSYIVFQTISYLLDVSKKRIPAERNLFHFSEYILFFPKILAGPITRYKDMVHDIKDHRVLPENISEGIQRLIIGLAKKVLVANQLGTILDNGVFSQNAPHATTGMAWLTLLLYSLHIYIDFSGYSDMAIGLGRIFGFRLPENFNFPYLSKSITEFWRRWHMTLSSWFRDYLFYPLERKSRKSKLFFLNSYTNTLLVFLATGLWHGFTLNFVIWGLIHGAAIVFEISPPGRKLKSAPSIFQHLYTLLVVMLGWVFFKARDTAFALSYLKILAGFSGDGVQQISTIANPFSGTLVLLAAILLCSPLRPGIRLQAWSSRPQNSRILFHGKNIGLLLLFVLSVIVMINSSYMPSLYGNF